MGLVDQDAEADDEGRAEIELTKPKDDTLAKLLAENERGALIWGRLGLLNPCPRLPSAPRSFPWLLLVAICIVPMIGAMPVVPLPMCILHWTSDPPPTSREHGRPNDARQAVSPHSPPHQNGWETCLPCPCSSRFHPIRIVFLGVPQKPINQPGPLSIPADMSFEGT
jgi:hypothetical protein